ncbi:hypothetical protein Tco_1230278 [Tanacetum coccineum]
MVVSREALLFTAKSLSLTFLQLPLYLKPSLIHILAFSVNILLGSVFMNYGAELTAKLDSITYKQIKTYRQKIKVGGIMGLAAIGPAVLWRCWPRQSSVWCVYGMSQVSSLGKSHRMPGMSAH